MSDDLTKAYDTLGLELTKGKVRGPDKKPRKKRGTKSISKPPNQTKLNFPEENTIDVDDLNAKIDVQRTKYNDAKSYLEGENIRLTKLRNNNGDSSAIKVIKDKMVKLRETMIEAKSLGDRYKKEITDSKLTKAYGILGMTLKKEEMTTENNGGAADGETVESVARYHKVKESVIQAQLKMGIPIELKNAKNKVEAKELAMDKIFKKVDFYTTRKKVTQNDSKATGKDNLSKTAKKTIIDLDNNLGKFGLTLS